MFELQAAMIGISSMVVLTQRYCQDSCQKSMQTLQEAQVHNPYILYSTRKINHDRYCMSSTRQFET